MLIYFQKYSKYSKIFYQPNFLTTCVIIALCTCTCYDVKGALRKKSHGNALLHQRISCRSKYMACRDWRSSMQKEI